MKTCIRCGRKKELTEFTFRKQTGKYNGFCKECNRAYHREYRKNNPPDRELLRKRQKEWRDNNPEKVKAKFKKWYSKNQEYMVNRNREKRNSDESYRLQENLRRRVRHALNGTSKAVNTLDLLGTDMETYKEYLELLFEDGMTWDNYGEWHIDHIIPLSYYDLSIKENQLKAFNFTNTRPLWATDNLKKSDNIPYVVGLLLENKRGEKNAYANE